MAYNALDNPYPAYDYECAGNVLVYDSYTKDGYAIGGYNNKANVEGGCYNEDYIYANWRLG